MRDDVPSSYSTPQPLDQRYTGAERDNGLLLFAAEGLTSMDQVKPIGVAALTPLYRAMAKTNPLVKQLKIAVDDGQIMPNVLQMGAFFSSVGAALQIATEGRASARQALQAAAAGMQGQ